MNHHTSRWLVQPLLLLATVALLLQIVDYDGQMYQKSVVSIKSKCGKYQILDSNGKSVRREKDGKRKAEQKNLLPWLRPFPRFPSALKSREHRFGSQYTFLHVEFELILFLPFSASTNLLINRKIILINQIVNN